MALESMWSLARLVTDDDDDDTRQASWGLVRWIVMALITQGASLFAWLYGAMDRYPWIWSILLCVMGLASGFVISRLYTVWKIKKLRQKLKDQSPPKRLKEAWEVPGAESQAAVAPQVTIRAHPERRWRAARSSLSAHRLRS